MDFPQFFADIIKLFDYQKKLEILRGLCSQRSQFLISRELIETGPDNSKGGEYLSLEIIF